MRPVFLTKRKFDFATAPLSPCKFFNANDENFKAISNIPPGDCYLGL